jgi:ribose 5-phosphate isomerase B
MKVAIAADKSGFPLKEAIKAHLIEKGHVVSDLGQLSMDDDWVYYYEGASRVARAILSGQAEKGILVCGTGAGMNIVANKFKGIYAISAEGVYSAKSCAFINGANVMTLGRRIVGDGMACEMCDEFLKYKQGDTQTAENVTFGAKLLKGVYALEEENFRY